jgi:hypothetical protein
MPPYAVLHFLGTVTILYASNLDQASDCTLQVSGSNGTPTILADIYRGQLQFFQMNAGIL